MKPLLEMISITKSFPGVLALGGVSFTLNPGSVHALMGENGAGKSTLMKCLLGVYQKDSGKITFEGEEVNFKNTREALDKGIAMVHQELNLALDLTVSENIWLGRFPTLSPYFPFISKKKMEEDTERIFSLIGIKENPRAKVSSLSVSRRQMLEIAKAVSFGAKVIVFDEPTSSLSDEEANKLFEIIKKLKEKGAGIIYISHKMEEILKISDTVTVMRDGEHIKTEEAKKLTTDEIIRLMVGRELTERYPEKRAPKDEILLSVDSLSGKKMPRCASFQLREGEILGVAGLEGSGRTELLSALFGMSDYTGNIYKKGKLIKNSSPRAAIKNGFAYITEERRKSGIFPSLSITENAVISSLDKIKRGPFVSEKKSASETIEKIKALRIKTPSEKAKIAKLSGGNQQKVILARWLLTEPEILLLDEPTRGIDIGAKYEIYKLIAKIKENGAGIIVVSSEMPELLGIADRIIVMSNGRIAGELSGESATQEKIMSLATRFL